MAIFTQLANTIFAGFNSDGTPREVNNADAQRWGTEVEQFINAFVAGGGTIFDTQASMNASLNYPANTMAWVINDPDPTKNGIYRKIGASGSGSWVRMGDLPYSFILATNAGAGTPNAIKATTNIPVPVADGGALIALPIVATNTLSPVTVSFNNATPLTIKTASGNDPVVGGLVPGVIAGYKFGTTFRMLSDQASAAIVAAAEAAADRAEEARDAALAAVPNAFPPTRTVLKGLSTSTTTSAYLTEPGREGQFVFRTGDYSAQIAADTLEGIFIKANDTAANLGAWVRTGGYYALGRAHFDWFGVPADNTPAVTAFNAMLATCALLGIYKLEMKQKGIYALSGAVIPDGPFDFKFNGASWKAPYTSGTGSGASIIADRTKSVQGGTAIGDMTGGAGLNAPFNLSSTRKNSTQSASVAAANGYVGRALAAAIKPTRFIIHGSTNFGFCNSAADPTITLKAYGKNGAPANKDDGTLLGTVTFTNAPGVIVFDNQTDNFVNGETLTGGTSGATMTLVKVYNPVADGGPYSPNTKGFLWGSKWTGTFVIGETVTGPNGSAVIQDIIAPRRTIRVKETTRWNNAAAPNDPLTTTGQFTHLWVAAENAAGTASTLISYIDIQYAAVDELTMSEGILDGSWDSADNPNNLAYSSKVFAFKNYKKINWERMTLKNCARSGLQPMFAMERTDMAVDFYNIDELSLLNCFSFNHLRYETIIAKSDDESSVVDLLNCLFSDQRSGGAPVSFFNLANVNWRGGSVSRSDADINFMTSQFLVDGVSFFDFYDKMMDIGEALFFTRAGVVKGCYFNSSPLNGITCMGNVHILDTIFKDLSAGLSASGSAAPAFMESVPGRADNPLGEWCAQKEIPSFTLVENPVFLGEMLGASGFPKTCMFFSGTAANPMTWVVRGADAGVTCISEYSVVSREAVGEILGVLKNGSVAVARHDNGTGAYHLNGEISPQAGASGFLLNRASAVASAATVELGPKWKRNGALSANKYDIEQGTGSPGITEINANGPNQPTTGITGGGAMAATVKIFRNGVWHYNTTANTALTMIPRSKKIVVRDTAALTADRAVTLDTTDAVPGSEVEYICQTTGGFNRTFLSGAKTLSAGNRANFKFDGTNWYLAGSGSI